MVYMIELAIAAGLALAAIIGAFLKGQSAERNRAAAKQLEKNARVQEQFDTIDRSPPDLDAAVGRLRKRTGADRDAPTE